MDLTQPRAAALIDAHPLTSTWALQPDAMHVVRQHLMAGPRLELDPSAAQAASTAEVPTTGGVAVIHLRGIMTARPSLLSMLFGGGNGGLSLFRACLREAIGSDEIGAILLDIDSPGGSTDLCDEVAAEIRAMRGEKPIIALANVQACSGAYYLASAADEIVVTPSGRVGSIGVFLLHIDETGLEERLGFKSTYVSAGKYKVEGNSSEPLTAEAEAHIQEVVDDYYDLFVEAVAAGRGVSAKAVRDGFAEGRVVTAKRAVELGMADRVDSFEGVVSKLAGTEASRAPTRALRVVDPLSAPAASTDQHEDKPAPKADDAEEERARIAALTTAKPHHH